MLWLAREDGEGGGCKGWLLPGAEGLEQSRVTRGREGGREGWQQGSSGIAAGPRAQLPAEFQPLSRVVGAGPSVVLCGAVRAGLHRATVLSLLVAPARAALQSRAGTG